MIKTLAKNTSVQWSQKAYPTGWGPEIIQSPSFELDLSKTFLGDVHARLARLKNNDTESHRESRRLFD